ncbi:hypothetical protein [Patulibacter sp.]|uniref:hypothetical protein n=1 Tax=Patulibacter sp. TaxID=1912859 RepID=UPI0027192A04|nr:hypothetical protein [Patulibacter sp.]MDO9408005.1 hypothetical protein [Patulibacter sp.]
MIVTALTEIPPDSGSAGYVVAAVIVSAILVLTYLVIVAFRVRDSARRLEALESRLDGAAARVGGGTTDRAPGGAVGDPAAVAAAAESQGARR